MFFNNKKTLQKLASEEVISERDLYDITVVTLDKNTKVDVGLTIGNLPDGEGVLVVKVKEGSLAWKAGIRVGAIILTVNEHSVGSHAQAVTLIDRSAKGIVTLGLARNSFREQEDQERDIGGGAAFGLRPAAAIMAAAYG